MLIILLPAVFAFAYFALNGYEHPLRRPGCGRPLTITLIVLLAALLWPLYAPLVTPFLPR